MTGGFFSALTFGWAANCCLALATVTALLHEAVAAYAAPCLPVFPKEFQSGQPHPFAAAGLLDLRAAPGRTAGFGIELLGDRLFQFVRHNHPILELLFQPGAGEAVAFDAGEAVLLPFRERI